MVGLYSPNADLMNTNVGIKIKKGNFPLKDQSPADEWIRKLWYIYTMEYYSAIKNNIFESVLMKSMKLDPNIQSVLEYFK